MRNYYKILPNITKINKPEVIFTDRASIGKTGVSADTS